MACRSSLFASTAPEIFQNASRRPTFIGGLAATARSGTSMKLLPAARISPACTYAGRANLPLDRPHCVSHALCKIRRADQDVRRRAGSLRHAERVGSEGINLKASNATPTALGCNVAPSAHSPPIGRALRTERGPILRPTPPRDRDDRMTVFRKTLSRGERIRLSCLSAKPLQMFFFLDGGMAVNLPLTLAREYHHI